MPRVLITGSSGLVGSSIKAYLEHNPKYSILNPDSKEMNLLNVDSVKFFIKSHKPDIVIASAAYVGGVSANATFPLDFILKNLEMQNNLIGVSVEHDVPSLIFVSSSCIYPRKVGPLELTDYMMGPPHESTRPYGIAKIAGMELVRAIRNSKNFKYTSLVPCNLYGPNDNFNKDKSHVIPALLRKFHEAKVRGSASVEIWGSPKVMREFMHSSDLAIGIGVLLETDDWDWAYNLGSGVTTSMKELSEIITEIIGFTGKVYFNEQMPRGIDEKLLDSSKVKSLGWQPKLTLKDGLEATYHWMIRNWNNLRGF